MRGISPSFKIGNQNPFHHSLRRNLDLEKEVLSEGEEFDSKSWDYNELLKYSFAKAAETKEWQAIT